MEMESTAAPARNEPTASERAGSANALVMAAAPELLAALKAFETFYFDVLPLLEQHWISAGVQAELREPPAVKLAQLAIARTEAYAV